VPWFAPSTTGQAGSIALRQRYLDGSLSVTVPTLLFLEVLNVAGRQLRWTAELLSELAAQLEDLGFHTGEPTLGAVAEWAGRGLTAYDAAYVALAQDLAVPLITADREIIRAAGQIARPPA